MHKDSTPSDTFFECVYYFTQAGSNFEPVYIFGVIYGLQRACILLSKVIYGLFGARILLRKYIRAQNWTQLAQSNIRRLKMYHWAGTYLYIYNHGTFFFKYSSRVDACRESYQNLKKVCLRLKN